MVIILLFFHGNIFADILSSASLEATETTVNETLYDMSTMLTIVVSDDSVTDVLTTLYSNTSKFFVLIFKYFRNCLSRSTTNK
jgi:hypothetical protein